MRLLILIIALIPRVASAQVGHFISERKIPLTIVSGFTSTDRYYTTTGPDYNLTGFSFWAVIDPVVNNSTNNAQLIFGKASWDQANAGWGFRTYQGTLNF